MVCLCIVFIALLDRTFNKDVQLCRGVDMNAVQEVVNPTVIHIEDKSYGMDQLVDKKVGLMITGLGKSTFEREVKKGHIPKMSYGSTKQAKVMFYVRDLVEFRNARYTAGNGVVAA
jgi:hypothetical protein